MNYLGISTDLRHRPELDEGFYPLARFNRAFLETAKQPISVAVERADGQMATCHTFIHGTAELAQADCYYQPSGEDPALGQGRFQNLCSRQ